MRFNSIHLSRFDAQDGSYSEVTDREYYDSQITITDHEAELILDFLGEDSIHRGNVRSNPELSRKEFKLFPSGKEIGLNLVFPKPKKQELRLYLSDQNGFKPSSGEIWFFFIKEDRLWLGSMEEPHWRNIGFTTRDDEFDETYQTGIVSDDEITITKLKERDVFKRDRNIAIERFRLADFKCEYDEQHDLFISRYTGYPYVEAHHLIPISCQPHFPSSLDSIENVFCICPNCHRAVHHAEIGLAQDILSTLAAKRAVLDNYGLDIPELHQFYGVEDIL